MGCDLGLPVDSTERDMGAPNKKGIPCGDPYDKDSVADWDLYGGPPILGNCHI